MGLRFLVVYLSVGKEDTIKDAQFMAYKLVNLLTKKTSTEIADRVSQILARKKELHISAIDDNSRERLEREIEEHEVRIDELVCQLYQIERIPS